MALAFPLFPWPGTMSQFASFGDTQLPSLGKAWWLFFFLPLR